MSDCDNRIACCPPDPFAYSLVNYPVVTNEELTFFIPCPDGFTCLYEMYEVTIPAGEIEYRPTTPDEDTDAKIQELAEALARARGYAALQPTPETFQSDAITVSCGEGAVGDLVIGTNPFIVSSTSVVIPAGMFSSTVSKVAANALATAFANTMFAGANCHWENVQVILECPEDKPYGGPIIVPPGAYTSTVSQEDADAQAIDAAEIEQGEDCTADPCEWSGDPPSTSLSVAVSESFGTVTPTVPGGSNEPFVGAVDYGEYTIAYEGGAYFDTDNPDPSMWKFDNMYEAWWNAGSTTQTLPNPINNGCSAGSQAAVEACMAGLPPDINIDNYDGGQISINFPGIVGNGLIHGSPDPSWSLTRTRKWNVPIYTQVRIVDYASFLADLTTCPSCAASANPAYDGTMPNASRGFPDSMSFSDDGSSMSINGQRFDASFCYFQTSGLPTASGAGWVYECYCRGPGGVLDYHLIWVGVKYYGDTPDGKYIRYDLYGTDPCLSAEPGCLEIETY